MDSMRIIHTLLYTELEIRKHFLSSKISDLSLILRRLCTSKTVYAVFCTVLNCSPVSATPTLYHPEYALLSQASVLLTLMVDGLMIHGPILINRHVPRVQWFGGTMLELCGEGHRKCILVCGMSFMIAACPRGEADTVQLPCIMWCLLSAGREPVGQHGAVAAAGEGWVCKAAMQ